MAFWNSLVPLLTKPEPSDNPVKPTVMPCEEKFYKGTPLLSMLFFFLQNFWEILIISFQICFAIITCLLEFAQFPQKRENKPQICIFNEQKRWFFFARSAREFVILTTVTIKSTNEILQLGRYRWVKNLIGWIRKNNRAARAPRFLEYSSTVRCQATAWNYVIWGSEHYVDSFISRSLRSCEGNCKENVTLIKKELLVRSSALRIIPSWLCVKYRRSVLSPVYLGGKACDIFSLFSSRICSFLPLLFLSREISC